MSPTSLVRTALVVALTAARTCVADVKLTEETHGGSKRYVLENQFVRLELQPSPGGQGAALIHKKTGRHLTRALSHTRAPGGSGLFIDRFWGDRQIRGFEKMPYEIRADDKSPVEASVTLALTHSGLRVEKTITLRRGVSSLRIEYRVTNEGTDDFVGKFWVSNGVFAGGREKSVHLHYPYAEYVAGDKMAAKGRRQITHLTYVPGDRPSDTNHWMNSPARAWGAARSSDGFGAAFEIEYPFLERFYSWQPPPGASEPFPTFEWLYAPMKLRPLAVGKAEAEQHPEEDDPLRPYIFRTGWTLIPFHGLPSVDGVAESLVASIAVETDTLRMAFLSDRGRRLRLVVSRTKLPSSTQPTVLHRAELVLSADLPSTAALPVSHQDNGTYVYVARLNQPGSEREVATFEKPYVHGAPDIAYELKPVEHKNPMFAPRYHTAKLGTDLDEPCVPWAKPLDKPIRILVVAPIRAHAEIAELCRRVDIDLTLVELPHPHTLDMRGGGYSSWHAPDPAKALEMAMNKEYDVLLLGGAIYWDRLPEALRGAIWDKVRSGAGLVYVSPRRIVGRLKTLLRTKPVSPSPAWLTRGIPAQAVPGLEMFKPLSAVSTCHELGQGRVLTLKFNPTPHGYIWRSARALSPAVDNDDGFDFPYWEYYYSLVARHILFAAKREPGIQVLQAQYSAADRAIMLTVQNSTAPSEVAIAMTARNRKWEQTGSHKRTVSLAAGANTVRLPLSADSLTLAGDHFFNVRITRGSTVVEWTTAHTVTRPRVRMESLALDKFTHEAGEAIRGKVTLNAPAQAEDGHALRCRVTDASQRLLADETVRMPAGQREIPFRRELSVPPTTTLSWLEVELLRQGKPVDYAKTYFTVERPREREVTFTVWGLCENNHWAQRVVAKRMREIGFDWNTGMHMRSMCADEVVAVARNSLAGGLDFMPMAMHDVRTRKLDGLVRQPCLTDPAYLALMEGDVLRHAGRAEPFVPPSYFVADENSLGRYGAHHDFCQSESCLARFRERLEAKYASLATLNRAWGTTFGRWDQVKPYTFDQAKGTGNFAPWAEHRRFMFRVFTSAFEKQKETLLEVDPKGRLAVSGMGVPLVPNGFDWYQLCRPLDYIVAYAGRAGVEDMLRSFKDKDDILGAWCGYARTGEQLRDKVWHELLNGFFHPGYWHYGYMLTHGDNKVARQGYEFKSIIDEIKHTGVGKMLVEAEWTRSAVAVHQSIASLITSNATGTRCLITQSLFNDNVTGWCAAIRGMGFCPPTFVSSEQIENGILTPKTHRVLVLPLSQAMSEAEVARVRAYVSAGGILVCDARAGMFTENSRGRDKWPLGEVFGVALTEDRVEDLKTSIYFGSKPESQAALPFAPLDRAIRLTTGKAHAYAAGRPRTRPVDFGGLRVRSKSAGKRTVPAVVLNRFGKGCGVYLNLLLAEYPDLGRRGVDVKGFILGMRATLAAAGLKQDVEATLPVGSEMVRYRDGATEYVGLCRRLGYPERDSRAQIKLPGETHVYDVRTHTYVGKTSTIETDLLPGQAKVYAVCTEKRGSIRVQASLSPSEGIRYRIRLETAGEQPCAGIVRLQASCNGTAKRHYSRNLKVQGSLDAEIPLALNERQGTWRLQVTDAITGVKDETTLQIGD